MTSITIENINGTFLEQVKKLALQAGASFQVFSEQVPTTKQIPTLPPFNQAILDMPRGDTNEDIFVRDYPQEYNHREIDWAE